MNHQTEGELNVSSLNWVVMKWRESLFHSSFFNQKIVKSAPITHWISMSKSGIGLLLGGLYSGMSQHYNTQDQSLPLLSVEAGVEMKTEKDIKSIFFVFASGTT
jgi:hypothetical protein